MSRRRKGRAVDGILVLDKPQGESSNRILQQVRHLFGAAKAGHTGALDPLATGVLPICFGEATKFSQLMLESDKAYITTARLGQRTETADSEGAIVQERPVPAGLTESALEAVLEQFRGDIAQIPSMYSALKHKGKPLYEYARQGITVDRPARPVTIYRLELLALRSEEIDLAVTCSKGTYIRSLVDDIGEALGCGAHVTMLRRTLAAGFPIDQAHSLGALRDRAEAATDEAELDQLLLPVDQPLQEYPALELEGERLRSIFHGQAVRMSGHFLSGPARLYGEGRFIGMGEVIADGEGCDIQPKRLLRFGS